jgi:N-acyl-D-amino-acid deacylase
MRYLCRCFCALLFYVPMMLSTELAQKKDPGYDLIIRHGKVVDGTGNPWFHADLAVSGNKIVAVERVLPGTAKREIDARGLIVAPGFIDIHSHSDFVLLEDGDAQSKIRQGVTTEVLGESGSAGPYQGKLFPPKRMVKGQETRWTTLGGYFDAVERGGVSTNVTSFVGLGNIWQSVMGTSHQRPTPEQFAQMKSLVEEAMKEGAMGLSTCLAMPPDSLATTDDLVELCKVVARYGGIFVVHVRNEGTDVFAAIAEAIEVGRRSGVRVEILHIKIADQQNWGRMNEIVKLVDDARKQGIEVGADVYPYTRGNNNLSSIIPPWAHEGGTAKMLARLKDAKERVKLKKDIREGITGWYNHYTAVGGDWGRMLISAKGSYQGLTMDRILASRAKGKTPPPDALDELFDILIEEGGSVSTIYDHHAEKDMNLAMVQPWCSIGSDGLAYATEGILRRGNPHPRSFGTFPRVLGVYVRERGLLRLEEAVRKMTSQNASKLGLTDRGLLRPGCYADITLFDAERVIDRATYTQPFQYSEGIEYVVVNGQVVLDQGKHTGVRPGIALRHQTKAQVEAQPYKIPEDVLKQTRPIFDGKTLDGWIQVPADSWKVTDGAMASTGAGRGVIYTRDDFTRYRLFFTMRHVSGKPDHQACVLIFCTRPEEGTKGLDALGAIQFQVPNGGHWDYRPGHNNAGKELFIRWPHPKFNAQEWSQVEMLVDATTGTARMAVAQPVGSKAVEVLSFKVAQADKVGPIAWQMHNKGLFDEYKDVRMEVNPAAEEFITTK